METHDHDPMPDPEEPVDPWKAVTGELGELRGRIRDTYRRMADDHGPTEEEIKEAFVTLAGAWDQVAESVTTALRDPDVRDKLRSAASSFANAVGVTFSELSSELGSHDQAGEEE